MSSTLTAQTLEFRRRLAKHQVAKEFLQLKQFAQFWCRLQASKSNRAAEVEKTCEARKAKFVSQWERVVGGTISSSRSAKTDDASTLTDSDTSVSSTVSTSGSGGSIPPPASCLNPCARPHAPSAPCDMTSGESEGEDDAQEEWRASRKEKAIRRWAENRPLEREVLEKAKRDSWDLEEVLTRLPEYNAKDYTFE